MNPLFTIQTISAEIEDGRLHVDAVLQEQRDYFQVDARLPAREVAALLPREIIVGEGRESSSNVLELINELLEKLAAGRTVRVWEYSGQTYCSFLKWGSVRFHEEAGLQAG